MHAPLTSHFLALKRILRYLSGCLEDGLLLQPGSLDITGYADSDWAGDKEDRKSTTGYCIFLGENLIAWSAKKQPTIARSSTEAEYKALANAAAEVMWITQLLKDLHSHSGSIPLIWCDNMGALALANNPVFHARTKHVEVDYHFIREKIQHKALQVDYIPSGQQLADMFTKPLCSPQFLKLKAQLPLFLPGARCFPGGNHLEGGCGDKALPDGLKNGNQEFKAVSLGDAGAVDYGDPTTGMAALALVPQTLAQAENSHSAQTAAISSSTSISASVGLNNLGCELGLTSGGLKLLSNVPAVKQTKNDGSTQTNSPTIAATSWADGLQSNRTGSKAQVVSKFGKPWAHSAGNEVLKSNKSSHNA